MNAYFSNARAMAIDAARPIIRSNWSTCSTERIGALCGLTANTVLKVAREMGLPERRAGRKQVAA